MLSGVKRKTQCCSWALVAFLSMGAACYAGEAEFSFEDLLKASIANTAKMKSGKGVLEMELRGSYFGGADAEKTTKVSFLFDGDKARFDRLFEDSEKRSIVIIDGSRWIETHEFTAGTAPQVNSRTLNRFGRSAFGGGNFDYRAFASPQGMGTPEQLLSSIESDVIKIKQVVTMESDGTYKATLGLEQGPGVELVFWFDPGKNFAMTRYLMRHNGQTYGEMSWQYEEQGELWALRSAEFRINATDVIEGEGVGRMTVLELELNVPIPPEMFTLKGLNLNPATYVYDKDAGIRYKVDPSADFKKAVDELLVEVDVDEPPVEVNVDAEEPVGPGQETAPAQPAELDEKPEGEVAAEKGSPAYGTYLIVAVLVVLVGLVVVVARRSNGRKKQQ